MSLDKSIPINLDVTVRANFELSAVDLSGPGPFLLAIRYPGTFSDSAYERITKTIDEMIVQKFPEKQIGAVIFEDGLDTFVIPVPDRPFVVILDVDEPISDADREKYILRTEIAFDAIPDVPPHSIEIIDDRRVSVRVVDVSEDSK